MKRFFGMMPSNCIEVTKVYKDDSGMKITVDAGKDGYTIMYADGGTAYKDMDATAEDNLKDAYDYLSSQFDTLTEMTESESYSEVYNC